MSEVVIQQSLDQIVDPLRKIHCMLELSTGWGHCFRTSRSLPRYCTFHENLLAKRGQPCYKVQIDYLICNVLFAPAEHCIIHVCMWYCGIPQATPQKPTVQHKLQSCTMIRATQYLVCFLIRHRLLSKNSAYLTLSNHTKIYTIMTWSYIIIQVACVCVCVCVYIYIYI